MTNNLIEQTNHSHHQPLLVKKNSSEVQSSQTLLGQMKKKMCKARTCGKGKATQWYQEVVLYEAKK